MASLQVSRCEVGDARALTQEMRQLKPAGSKVVKLAQPKYE